MEFITLPCECESLYKSLIHILKRNIIRKNKTITFRVNSFYFLSQRQNLKPLQILQLAESLYLQTLFLKQNERKGFAFLNPTKILCVDEHKFICIDDLYDIDDENRLDITFPYEKEDMTTYMAQEVKGLQNIPAYLPWDVNLCSLGLLCKSYFAYAKIKSPLFYFIERCIEERKFLYL